MSSPKSCFARSFDCTKIKAGGLMAPSCTACRKLNNFPSSWVMKSSFCSTSGAAAFTSPMLTRIGAVRMEFASSHTAGGMVAENMSVCKRPPLHFGQKERISSICGAKPKSSNLSASSKIKCRVASNEIKLSRSIWASRNGVTTATSSLLMFCAFSPESLSSRRPVHFRPTVSFSNSSSVCLASSRVGSMMTARANSFPGFPSSTSTGPRNAIVLPLPVGAEARTWLPPVIAGKHCICTGVGFAKPSAFKFRTSQSGTPRPGIASKDSIGSGAPALTWIRFRRRNAATSSLLSVEDDLAPPASPAAVPSPSAADPAEAAAGPVHAIAAGSAETAEASLLVRRRVRLLIEGGRSALVPGTAPAPLLGPLLKKSNAVACRPAPVDSS
mmetsp:Transcript_54280/g.151030  ORF Transcript_54280/g.151030 Transcript_54280/m.151030 type:complete len:385 (-) Transcript_54280:178-1332(-)